MSNFDFLQKEWHDIYELTKEAESCIWSKPVYTCLTNRKALEKAVIWMYKNDADLVMPYDTSLNSLLHEETFVNGLLPVLVPKVNIVKKLGNIAAHEDKKLSDQDALKSSMELFDFLYWFYMTYSVDEPIRGLKFDSTIIPKTTPEQAEIERLKREIEKREQEILKKEDLIKENQELLEKVKQIKSQKRANPKDYNYNEEQTRKYFIDVLLKEVGWDITKPDATEYEVEGMPNSTGLGYVDYVLWGDNGKPLGLVEAKRTMRDAKIGREQAELYANCLEKKFRQRPIMFYSNGYEHYIWDDLNYPPRRVSGFYSKDDLQRLINRRESKRDLVNIDIKKEITDRPYQERCIKSVCDNFQKKNRKSLLVMATGTGKTRVAISIADILTRFNWAKRILFLADRVPLVVQAQRSCAKLMPSLNPINLLKAGTDCADSRFVVSTYQTMMNLINAKKADEKYYSVGYFDLIIVDEAHRSIYKRYGEIFNYFDSLMLGLTATPKNEIDKNTYEVFELENGVPTDCYEYQEAVDQGYLVPYESFDTSTKFLREGIKYSELSDEEKEEYELNFYDEETDSLPEIIDKDKLNRWLFNKNTVDQILENLMTNGIKVQGGNKLGKTIIFAVNQDHADFIAERFDKNYKQYNGKFARVITYKTEYAQKLIDEFSVKEQEPTIAISVDKLDTGIDVLEVVNLVFFKPVRSYTKFIQMIGRGTRLCPDLFGPNDDKKKFYIFDACGNFEYFDSNPPKAGGSSMSLNEKLFLNRLELAEKIKDDEEVLKLFSSKIKDNLHNLVQTMDRDNFIIRNYMETVEKFSNRDKWNNLDDLDFLKIKNEIAKLPTTDEENKEFAKRFDLIIVNTQLALYSRDAKLLEKYINKIRTIANILEEKSSIPLVRKNIELIEEIQKEEYWKDITISELEEIRIKLRDLIELIDNQKREVVYTNFEDEMNENPNPNTNPDTPITTGVDMAQYRKKVEAFLQEHQNEIAINKLKYNKPLTTLDIEQLEKILKENADIIGTEDKLKSLMGNLGLGEFIRSVIGLDSTEVEKVFAKYLDTNNFNANQIRFIDKIISYLKKNGTMLDIGTLYETPFTDLNAEGIDGIFSSKDADNIIYLIQEINNNAKISM